MSGHSETHGPDGARSRALRYLEAHHVVTIATAEPWAAAVFYVNDGFTLFFLSSPRSRHAQQAARDARVAATVQEDYSDWRSIKGLQIAGIVREVERERVAEVRALYAAKFPVIAGGMPGTVAIVEALKRITWFALTPTAVYFVDNAAGFGHRDEIRLP